jgi:choline dehydrogenase-like flavoprotein
MEHLIYRIADAVTFDGYEMQFETPSPEKWYFEPSAEARRKYHMGSSHMWLREHVANPSAAKEFLLEVMCLAPNLSDRLLKLASNPTRCGARIMAEFEQMPRPDNRIELDRNAADAFGVARPRLFWKKSDAERRTALVSARLLGEALIRQDIGRERIREFLTDGQPWPDTEQFGSWHHMGGTRMAASPEHGVVDRDCRVFGMSNLFVGGSSVFPTGGHANPTYSIVQLALRLGDHLAANVVRASS